MVFCLLKRIVPLVSFWPLGLFHVDVKDVWYFLRAEGTAFLWFLSSTMSTSLAFIFSMGLFGECYPLTCKTVSPTPILRRFLYHLLHSSHIATELVCSGVSNFLDLVWCHLRGWWRVRVERNRNVGNGKYDLYLLGQNLRGQVRLGDFLLFPHSL